MLYDCTIGISSSSERAAGTGELAARATGSWELAGKLEAARFRAMSMKIQNAWAGDVHEQKYNMLTYAI